MSSWVFRNGNDELGFMQQRDDRLYLHIKTESLYLNPWINRVYSTALFQEVDEELSSLEEVEKFIKRELTRSYPDINSDIVDISESQHPGAYYPRMAKDKAGFNYVSKHFLQDMRAYQNIQNSLDSLFNYIEPSEENFTSYGHKIRELLILSCTEVEYLLQKFLTDNGYTHKKTYNTSDYIHCKSILKLDEYEVTLKQYTTLSSFKPFKEWVANCPTKSLKWYSAYNSVKHNRGETIQEANLQNLLLAISAIHIILESQYGEGIFHPLKRLTTDESIFYTKKQPSHDCSDISSPYIGGYEQVKFTWSEQRAYFQDYPV